LFICGTSNRSAVVPMVEKSESGLKCRRECCLLESGPERR
jgi:hypothetical protein